jgi:hypothetical protein
LDPDREFIIMITWDFLPALLLGSGCAATVFGCVCLLADESRRNGFEPLRAPSENLFPKSLQERVRGPAQSATGSNPRLLANAVLPSSKAAAKVAPVVRMQDARALVTLPPSRPRFPAAALR